MIQPHLLKHLEQRVPRYTSYPTAADFASQIDATRYVSWLAELPTATTVSVYVHIPFCSQLCLYCGCHTTVARRHSPVEAYVELLLGEIALVGGILGNRRATHLHFGGGTPTILMPHDLQRVMAALRMHFHFTTAAEVAIEIDPRTFTREYAVALAANGFTRVSLGVQDFDAKVQATVNRMQSFEQTARVADWLRAAGVAKRNLDLMYGLPYQSVASVTTTIRQALALDADRIALFGYAHVPWMKHHQRLIPEHALPGSSQRFAQSQAAAEVLVSGGYDPIGLDHFAKRDDLLAERQRAGRLHRNFQGYTTDESRTLIGFGASAIGALPDGYVQNASSAVAYRNSITAGRLATARGCALTAGDRLRRDVIERLMCDLQVDLAEHCAAHGFNVDYFTGTFAKLDALAADGLLERAGSKLKVAAHSRAFVRNVCATFDTYRSYDEEHFSRAC